LDVQKNVVIEEFKQRYINQPYGDVWFHLRAMAYQEHPYMWPTIGKDIAHIEQASLEEVLNFYQQFYTPQNAVLVVSGNIDCEHAFSLVDRWFSDIAKPDIPLIKIPEEPVQSMGRRKEVQAKVPLDAFYKVYHMPGRYSPGYYSCDLISDMLGHGKSSRLYRRLVKENPIFSHLSAQILGSVDPGLLVVSGMLNQGRELEEAEEAVQNVIEAALNSEPFSEEELHAAKSQAELQISFGFSELMNRSVNLAQCKALGDASLINREFDLIKGVSLQHAHHWAQHVLKEENSSTLYYRASNHEQ
jgi:predicted Zn-dependent peptidase